MDKVKESIEKRIDILNIIIKDNPHASCVMYYEGEITHLAYLLVLMA